jgi:hypothetical protein
VTLAQDVTFHNKNGSQTGNGNPWSVLPTFDEKFFHHFPYTKTLPSEAVIVNKLHVMTFCKNLHLKFWKN